MYIHEIGLATKVVLQKNISVCDEIVKNQVNKLWMPFLYYEQGMNFTKRDVLKEVLEELEQHIHERWDIH